MNAPLQRWTGFGDADPALSRALDIEELIRAGDAWDAQFAALPDAGRPTIPPAWIPALAFGAIGLGLLLLVPAPGGRRR